MATDDEMRAAFEAWARIAGLHLDTIDGDFVDSYTRVAYGTFMAGWLSRSESDRRAAIAHTRAEGGRGDG